MSVDGEDRSGRPSTGTTKENMTKFDIEGILPKKFVPPGQTVNGTFFCRRSEANEGKHPAPTSRQAAQRLLGPES